MRHHREWSASSFWQKFQFMAWSLQDDQGICLTPEAFLAFLQLKQLIVLLLFSDFSQVSKQTAFLSLNSPWMLLLSDSLSEKIPNNSLNRTRLKTCTQALDFIKFFSHEFGKLILLFPQGNHFVWSDQIQGSRTLLNWMFGYNYTMESQGI